MVVISWMLISDVYRKETTSSTFKVEKNSVDWAMTILHYRLTSSYQLPPVFTELSWMISRLGTGITNKQRTHRVPSRIKESSSRIGEIV